MIRITTDEGLNQVIDFTPQELKRLVEIHNHPVITEVTIIGRDEDRILVVDVNATRPLHCSLYVLSSGGVAEANLNQPRYFDTLNDLLTA